MKVSVPGMPTTLLNMSNNDIYKMVSGDKMDVKMNIFQRLWETLRHLFWLDKQPEAYKLLFNFVNNKAGNINASEYFTGAIDENEREKFINSLELFNKLKTCAKNPDEMVAKGNMRWVAQAFGDIELSVTFLIENNEICTQTLQLCKGLGSLGVDLRKAYLPGVDMRNCYLGKKTIIDKKALYLEPGWNANLDGATLDGAILDGATVDGATRLYAEVIIINKITPKKIVTEGVATEEIATKEIDTEEITTIQSTAEKLLPTQLLNDPE
ncbi:T3SS effector EspY1 [Escherichia coli]|uniref:T3SS effector EspY1 n=1 Tax=Escherichia coli TaxID=562 RepID=UPI000B7CADD3|nr:T3SS effector EspY1 [Escherichia coli]EIF5990176.1 pentapeptide repeat-containing protein [Escherichia coli]EIF5994470.1 pentapeptide repeat-containing protein [Escherichia coli]EKT5611891.1 pentapeptide repeat-containing protein [Escherichia coli]ELR8592609.1 pentapeptide repeat-containing protein [Escherichia coli]MBB6856302.1 pentapeptide repeat-containing protein [Escherichia coli]